MTPESVMRLTPWSVLWILLVAPVSATAQTTLYVLLSAEPFSSCVPPLCLPDSGALIAIDADAGRVSSMTPVPNGRGPFQQIGVTADGRYVAWTGADARTVPEEPPFLDVLSVFDRVTGVSGEVLRLPPVAEVEPVFTTLLTHPSRPEALARFTGRPVLAVAPSGIRAFAAGCESPLLENMTTDGRNVLLRCPDAAVVLDVDTGLEVHRRTAPGFEWAISGDGTELFRVFDTPASPSNLPLVTRFDIATGAVLAERTLEPSDLVRELRVDPRTGRLFAELFSGILLVLAPDTLETLVRLAPRLPALVPSIPGYNEPVTIRRIAFDRDQPRAFMLATRQRRWPLPPPYGYEAQIDVIDTETLTSTAGGTMLLDAPVADMALVPLPPRPLALSATVQGSHVTLGWTAGTGPGVATRYRIEVGTSPGALNAVIDTPLPGVAGVVPAGTYFVRVRGVNFGGLGPPSDEIVVHVPQ